MSGKFVCFVKGNSDKKMLEEIIPRLIGVTPHCIPFDGKEELKAEIKDKLAKYRTPNSVFLIMCDQNKEDCKALKKELLSKVSVDKKQNTKIRIACHEKESFFLGDLQAVGDALGFPKLSTIQDRYMSPDKLFEPFYELVGITQNGYQRIADSRNISMCIRLDGTNKSHSFNMLIGAIKELHQILKNSTHS